MPKSPKPGVCLFKTVHENLSPKYPTLRRESKDGQVRLNIPLNGDDSIIVDQSSKISDGLRIGYVLDLDSAHSTRRIFYKEHLLRQIAQVESELACPVVQRERLEYTAATRQTRWCKIGHHRRMGVHVIVRNLSADWTDPVSAAGSLTQDVGEMIERLLLLARRFPASGN